MQKCLVEIVTDQDTIEAPVPSGRGIRTAKTLVLLAGALLLLYFLVPSSNTAGDVKADAKRRPMPDFSLQTLNGNSWSLNEHRGQVVLVNLWATWCPPCRAETPGLVNLNHEFEGRGFSLVGIAMDDDPASVVPGFVNEYHMTYQVLLPGNFALAQSTESLPTSFLVDKNGRVARTYTGMVSESVLRRDVEALLSE